MSWLEFFETLGEGGIVALVIGVMMLIFVVPVIWSFL